MDNDNQIKTIAMYLPQYYRTKENDEWWGKGYTDWVATKNAKPLFRGHYEPRLPLNQNYYDLAQKEPLLWQAGLMKQYGVDGLCFYHYWFKDGKQMLEKPAENLLQWKDIDMSFCFCWANERWARSWSKFDEYTFNDWAPNYETTQTNAKTGVLVDQDYGAEEQWKEHFDYLLPFFKDSRYITIDGRPVFLIYKPNDIIVLDDMLTYWKSLAEKAGIQEIYVITIGGFEKKCASVVSAMLYHEPQATSGSVSCLKEQSPVKSRSYDSVWENILNRPYNLHSKAYYGGFVSYDDTPRQGAKGYSVVGDTPQKFQQYYTELLAKNYVAENEFVFINAWNEWGEGMYLEPDEKNGYHYLEAIKQGQKEFMQYVPKYKRALNLVTTIEKYRSFYQTLDKWMSFREKGLSILKPLKEEGIQSIAIYGMGVYGRHLLAECKKEGLAVKYFIDKRAALLDIDVRGFTLDDELPEVDAIIVTPFNEWTVIKEELKKRTQIPLVRLDLLFWKCEKL